MVAKLKPPRLDNPHIAIRLARSKQEIDAANSLVFKNYVEDGFWENDEKILRTSKYLHCLAREVFVALDAGSLVGTMSIIHDSKMGLPSDKFQPEVMKQLRATGDSLAEVSALAMDKSYPGHRSIVLFLMKFAMQYSFYYAGIDRLVVACKPRHAAFYRSVIRFQQVGETTYYDYSHHVGELLTLNLIEAHKLLSEYYETDAAPEDNFYRFMLVHDHPSLHFPEKRPKKRSPNIDWVAQARLMDMRLAV